MTELNHIFILTKTATNSYFENHSDFPRNEIIYLTLGQIRETK
jgi:hypothetical protein